MKNNVILSAGNKNLKDQHFILRLLLSEDLIRLLAYTLDRLTTTALKLLVKSISGVHGKLYRVHHRPMEHTGPVYSIGEPSLHGPYAYYMNIGENGIYSLHSRLNMLGTMYRTIVTNQCLQGLTVDTVDIDIFRLKISL